MKSTCRNLMLFVLLALAALVAAPSAHAQVTPTSATLTRDKTTGVITAQVTIIKKNPPGTHYTIAGWTLGAANATSVSPVNLPLGISTVTLTFPGSAGLPGTQATLTVFGRVGFNGWGGFPWHQSLTVTLP